MDLRFLAAGSFDQRIIGFPTRSHASNPDYNNVEPGDHSLSEIWLRDASMDANQMPPLGRSKVDEVWVLRLAEWIDGLGEEATLLEDVLVYPNPTNANVTLLTPAEWTAPFRVRIFDLAGRLLQQSVMDGRGGELNLSSYPSGVLILYLEDAAGRRQKKKVVKR